MYGIVLVTHSWWRWIVLLTGLLLLGVAARGVRRPDGWGDRSDLLRRAFLRILDVQFLLGVLLYLFLSPLPRVLWADMGTALADPVLRFYSVEHVFGMLVGVSVAHFGLERAGKLAPSLRPRRVLWTQVVWLLVTLASIPWPWLAYGRPLFRPW